MSTANWKSFDYWKGEYDKKGIGFDMPFRTESLTSDTVFMWSRVTAPLPSGIGICLWEWFPEVTALVGYIRFVFLPKWYGLYSDKCDSGKGKLFSSEEIFTDMEQVISDRESPDVPADQLHDYRNDFLIMKGEISKLDNTLNLPEEHKMTKLQEILRDFNERWESTPGWESHIQVFNSPIEVGEEIVRREEAEDEQRDDFESWRQSWLETCSNALSDKDAQKEFLAAIEEIEG